VVVSREYVIKVTQTYQNANELQGMNTTKPGIFLQKPVIVKKDTLRRWA